MIATSLLTLALMASPAFAATIVQTLAQRPELSSVNGLAKDFPAWAGPGNNKTLIVPTNDAHAKAVAAGILPATNPGAFFLPDTLVDHRTRPNYKILKNAKGDAILFDNYVPEGPPEIHLRTSANNGLATGQVQCDDGWLYIADIAIEPALKPSQSAVQGPPQASAFIELFKATNLLTTLDSLKDVTIFAPSNAALAAAQATLATLAPNQVAAVLAAHIAVGAKFSVELDPTKPWLSLNPDVPLNLTVANESASINGVKLGMPVDTPTSAGPIHILDGVIVPAKLPAANGSPVALGTATAGPAATATATATGTAVAGTPVATRSGAPPSATTAPPAGAASGPNSAGVRNVPAAAAALAGLVGYVLVLA
ncbi:FAS1 domain-containing protein [Phlyctochytrium arcticum]|nr:FAS1 domain-containing protein [Phlyctochytrium arcticum]